MESVAPPQAVPLWIRGPWPLALATIAGACLWLPLGPLNGFDRRATDFLLYARMKAGLSPHPDANVFLIGIQKNDFEDLPGIAAEYKAYAEIVDIVSDLGAAVTVFDLILARGTPAEAAPILAAARRSRGVVFAEADIGEEDPLKSFPFAPERVPEALINIKPDSDGIVRGYEYARGDARVCRPSLALAAYLASRGALSELSCARAGFVSWLELTPDYKALTHRTIPSWLATVNYRSGFTQPWDTGFKYASLSDLRRKYAAWLPTRAPVPADLPGAGSLVLVGSVAPGLGDSDPTPFGSSEPGVQVQASALTDLLQEELLSPIGVAWQIAAVAILITVLTLGGALATGFRSLLTLWLVQGIAAPLTIAFLGLIRWHTVYPAVTPAVLVTICCFAEGARRWGLVSLEKVRLRTTMAMYFSPLVMEEVLRNPGALEPREAELTVLLTDVRNFTSITERLGTKVVFDLMNRVFEIETRAVMATDGSMEHFLGDQFLGYWGAPKEQPDASDRAMKAGHMIIEGLDELRRSLPPELAEPFGFGVAIHRGKALVGNKGSRFRFDYGILGDIVNTAARAESLTKLYGVRWIVSREVLATVAPQAHRFLDRVRVKGRAHSVDLIEAPAKPDEAWLAMAARYEEAWSIYKTGRFSEALAAFENLASETCDPPSRLLAERCRELIASSPAAWDGTYTLRDK